MLAIMINQGKNNKTKREIQIKYKKNNELSKGMI